MDILFNETSMTSKYICSEIEEHNSAHLAIIAGSDTGKNILLFNILLDVGKLFKYIHVLTGTDIEQYQNVSYGNRIFAIPNTVDGPIMLKRYITKLKDNIKKSPSIDKHLIILDDLTKECLDPLKDFLNIIRHFKISIFVITQQVLFIPPGARTNFKFWFVKYKSSLGGLATTGAGILNWANKEIKDKDIEKYINMYSSDKVRSRCMWIGIQCSMPRSVGIFSIPTDFFTNNFDIVNGKSRFNKQLLSHQYIPKHLREMIENNNS